MANRLLRPRWRAAHTPIGRRSGSKCKDCMYDQDAWIKEMGDCPHKTSAPLERCWLFSGIFSTSSFGNVLSIKRVLHHMGWSIAALEIQRHLRCKPTSADSESLAFLSSLFKFFFFLHCYFVSVSSALFPAVAGSHCQQKKNPLYTSLPSAIQWVKLATSWWAYWNIQQKSLVFPTGVVGKQKGAKRGVNIGFGSSGCQKDDLKWAFSVSPMCLLAHFPL